MTIPTPDDVKKQSMLAEAALTRVVKAALKDALLCGKLSIDCVGVEESHLDPLRSEFAEAGWNLFTTGVSVYVKEKV